MSLEDDILGPLDEPGKVALGLYAVADSEVAGLLFEERVSLLLYLLDLLVLDALAHRPQY